MSVRDVVDFTLGLRRRLDKEQQIWLALAKLNGKIATGKYNVREDARTEYSEGFKNLVKQYETIDTLK